MSQEKARNIIPKIEDCQHCSTWAFTINPSEQYFDDAERVLKVDRSVKRLLNSHRISYRLYREVSCNGRWHYHGHITIKDPLLFYVHDIPHIISRATIAIEPINDEEGWYDYCTKQCHIIGLRPIFKSFGLDFEEELVFEYAYTKDGKTNRYEKVLRPRQSTTGPAAQFFPPISRLTTIAEANEAFSI